MSAYWIPFKTFILLVLACPQLLWSHVHAALPEFIFCVAHSHKRKTRSLTLRKCHCTITCVIAASHQRWFDHSTLKSKYYCSFITHRLVIQASVGGQTDRRNKEILFNKGGKKREMKICHRSVSVSSCKKMLLSSISPRKETAAEYLN